MSIRQHLETFAGLPVHTCAPDGELADPATHAIRIALDWEDAKAGFTFLGLLGELLARDAAARIRALVVGAWDFEDCKAGKIFHFLASHVERLPALEALFFGDIVQEELEISWIPQGDVTLLFSGLPRLRTLRVRGSNGLKVDTIRHANLEELAFETGGLPREVLRSVAAAELPRLRHLELWLGDRGYGWDGAIEDLVPFLDGSRFPALRTLALKNSEIQDEVAMVVAASPVLGTLETLDLSMGTLSEKGAKALLAAPGLRSLRKLDIHHHYVPADLVVELQKVVPEVDASEPQEEDEDEEDGYRYRYVAVSE